LAVQNKTILTEATAQTINEQILDSISRVKGKKVIKLDMRNLDEAPTDFFIICEGDSTTQVSALADRIVKDMRENFNQRPNHIEGTQKANWILVDYFTTVVHIFLPETRRYYELEELWSDANTTEFHNL
jgi:ribosome-associated protein